MKDYSKEISKNWDNIVYSYETGGRKVPKKFTASSATEIFFDIFNKIPTAQEKKYFIKELNEYAYLWHMANN